MIQIQYLDAAPELTDDASSGTWANLLWHEQFTPPGQPGAEPVPGTAVAMGHDGNILYVAVRCSALPGTTPEKLAREHVQIQLDPECRGERSGTFVCYTDGKASSSIELQDGGKLAWTGEIGYDVLLQEGQWSMVLKVPLSQLVHLGDGLSRLQFMVARVFGHGGDSSDLRSLCHPAVDEPRFWIPRNAIGQAVFERPESLEAFAWSVRHSGSGQIVRKNGNTVVQQNVMATNFSTDQRRVELRVGLAQPRKSPGSRLKSSLNVDAGQSSINRIELPIPAGFKYGFIHMSLHEPETGRCLSENRGLVEAEPLSWKEHFIKRGDGNGGYTCLRAEQQILPQYQGRLIVPYGLATMDNGEVICAATAEGNANKTPRAGPPEQTLITTSSDNGATWASYTVLDNLHARPMMLACLGQGVVTFDSGDTTGQFRFFSHDYGRTWDERVTVPPAPNGLALGFEGSPLVDRDAQGNATRIAQTGQTVEGAAPYWKINEYILWSDDGGRTWPKVDSPQAWRSTETYNGKTYDLCCGEGSLVRAANGWLVAALRTWVPVQFHDHPYFDDNLEGTSVSISKDDGATWSPLQMIFEGGRHHPTLLCMPGGDLVMVVIRRVDFRNGELVSYRRGCDAVISHDHGETWDIEHMIVLDDVAYCNGEHWIRGECGHVSSTLLPDESILTGYCNTYTGGVLIRWKP
jgi:hypothetical protein